VKSARILGGGEVKVGAMRGAVLLDLPEGRDAVDTIVAMETGA
jgi:hypothetical protein